MSEMVAKVGIYVGDAAHDVGATFEGGLHELNGARSVETFLRERADLNGHLSC